MSQHDLIKAKIVGCPWDRARKKKDEKTCLCGVMRLYGQRDVKDFDLFFFYMLLNKIFSDTDRAKNPKTLKKQTQYKERSITPLYYRGADAAILVFDITDENPLKTVKEWITEVQGNSAVSPNVVLAIVANKMDIAKQNPSSDMLLEQAKELAEDVKALFFETSAKTSQGIQIMFETLAKRILHFKLQNLPKKSDVDHAMLPPDWTNKNFSNHERTHNKKKTPLICNFKSSVARCSLPKVFPRHHTKEKKNGIDLLQSLPDLIDPYRFLSVQLPTFLLLLVLRACTKCFESKKKTFEINLHGPCNNEKKVKFVLFVF
ncbi:Rab GTPase [Reticulomyxa filosa]|uniref:Rab GTPase n=1 Tax=Reticulomyxa filosa TaxID=46433 RepID=X6N4E6_RETFI|nr:Rab GTPase [Reticulomyxa filosa]|eukprot:ETO20634.1 Rab GTPase [Reticulomyxa filosa]